MPDLVTKEFRLHNAEQFKEQFDEAVPDNVYLFIAKPLPWPDDANPPDLTPSVNQISYSPYETMIAMKRVTGSDVSYAVPRYNWVSGTTYSQYDSTKDFFSGIFYVITDEYKVYKVLSNAGSVPSINKPTSISTTRFQTADGYVWKYMFTLNAANAVKFLTNEFFPVQHLTSDDGSDHWDVQTSAVDGSIEYIGVTSGGSGYNDLTGVIVSATTNTVVLPNSASAVNAFYVNHTIYITSGTGAGQLRRITTYTGGTKSCILDDNWSTIPDATSNFYISPVVNVVDHGSGTGFSGYVILTAGSVSGINVLNSGHDYTKPVASIPVTGTTEATLYASRSPIGGHGANSVDELYAHNVAINIKMTGNESNLIPVGNDFRVIGLVSNPLLVNSSKASAPIYDMTTKLAIVPQSGTFTVDEQIVGQVSGAKAILVRLDTSNLFSVNNVEGVFQNDEIIQGASSGAVASLGSVTQPLIKKYSGRVMYIKNQSPIYRSNAQVEDYRIVVKF